MIPQIVLDDENFSQITERVRNRISELAPEWTDYNLHDPGITVLELFAWLVEMQQFHLDQTGERHITKYLRLMGIEQEPVHPAEAEVRLCGIKTPALVPRGSRFFAGNVCFETAEDSFLDTVTIKKLVCAEHTGGKGGVRRETGAVGKKVYFPAFGTSPEVGNSLWIGLDGALTPNVEHKLCMHFFSDAPIARNPVGGKEEQSGFVPLAEYSVRYRGPEGEREAEKIRDTTYQMIQDGFLSFVLKEQMQAGEDGLYWLNLILEKCEYDMPPVIEDISLSCLTVRQKRTLAEIHDGWKGECIHVRSYLAGHGEAELYVESDGVFWKYQGEIERRQEPDGWNFFFPGLLAETPVRCSLVLYDPQYRERMLVGEGNGMPGQSYALQIDSLCRRGLLVFAETGAGSGCYERWRECSDFDASSPADRHFHYEEETGILSFGDRMHGAAPCGKIFLVSAQTSLGASGNVKAGSIDRAQEPIAAAVENGRDAVKGADAETVEQCRMRLLKQQDTRYRAVTYKDFELLVMQTPGLMIENVRAVFTAQLTGQNGLGDRGVSVVVKPYSNEGNPAPKEAYRRNIINMLKRRRMIGTEVNVLAPEYIGVSVFADIKANIRKDMANDAVRKILKDYFDEIRAEFGACIPYSVIYGKIDVQSFVTEIRSLSMNAQGSNVRRSRNGDIILPVNGLAYLMECTVC